jgi:hypothetical protein
MAMNVNNVQMSEAALRMLQAADGKPVTMQVSMPKKAPDPQQVPDNDLLKQLEGKGLNVDFRV